MDQITPRRVVGDDEARWLSKFTPGSPDECWEWRKVRPNGYGYFLLNGREQLAHRLSYEMTNGDIAPGLVLDHLCRNTRCINPAHLEAVTQLVNVQRGRSSEVMAALHRARTHCCHGHEFTSENTYYSPSRPKTRRCRACDRANDLRKRKNRRSQSNV